MIKVVGLTKRFGGKLVLRGLDLNVEAGEVVALLGANGAGKTTFLRILASLAKPTLGEVRIAGHALSTQASALRSKIGFLGHQPLLYGDLSAEQNLYFFGRLYGLADVQTRVDELLDLLGLSARRRDPVSIFSRGMQQRLAIGRTILHKPDVLLLDEPHTGLDQHSVAILNDLLRTLADNGSTILMASHDLENATQLALRMDILAGGRIIASHPRGKLDGRKLAEIYANAVQNTAGVPNAR